MFGLAGFMGLEEIRCTKSFRLYCLVPTMMHNMIPFHIYRITYKIQSLNDA